jgi:hypothetical protein
MMGDALFGIGGMLLAVPIAASVQIVVLHVVPRLGRRIEVKLQEDAPEGTAAGAGGAAAGDQGTTMTVDAGEGVISTPRRVSEPAPGAAALEPPPAG